MRHDVDEPTAGRAVAALARSWGEGCKTPLTDAQVPLGRSMKFTEQPGIIPGSEGRRDSAAPRAGASRCSRSLDGVR